MATEALTPRQRSLELLNEALSTGIRGRNREAIESAIEVLEDDGKGGLNDLHYKRLPVGQTLRDPNRRGLWMRKNKSAAIWIFNYTSPVTGDVLARQFGTYPKMSLIEARERWGECRALLNENRDPFLEEDVTVDRTTVKELCERFINEYAKDNKRSWREDQRMFDFDLVRVYGDTQVVCLSRDEIESLLDEIIDRGAPRSAEKLLTATRKLLNHAIKKRWVNGLTTNPCQHIELQKRSTSTPYLNEVQIRSFVRNLPNAEKLPDTIKDILTLQFQTVARVSEVAGMGWDEIDFRHGIWNLPAERSKNKQGHRVMLSKQSLVLLKRRKNVTASSHVFPSDRTSKPYPATLVARHLRTKRDHLEMPDGASTHSLRHTAMTQLASMGCGKELRDRISNHKDSSVDAIYQHYEYDSEAKEWWQAWADRLDELAADNEQKQKEKKVRRV